MLFLSCLCKVNCDLVSQGVISLAPALISLVFKVIKKLLTRELKSLLKRSGAAQ